MVFCYGAALVSLGFAVAFFSGRGLALVKGYSGLAEEEKRKINEKALCVNVGFVFLLSAAFFGLTGFSETFRENYFRYAMIVWMVLCVADAYYISKSKRFAAGR